MTTQEERMMILRMIENGKISAEDGTRLIAALGGSEQQAASAAGGGAARFMRIRVTDQVTGQQKVSVNLPMALVTFALRFVPEGNNVDKQALQAAIDAGLTGRIVDITDSDDGTHVEIFLE